MNGLSISIPAKFVLSVADIYLNSKYYILFFALVCFFAESIYSVADVIVKFLQDIFGGLFSVVHHKTVYRGCFKTSVRKLSQQFFHKNPRLVNKHSGNFFRSAAPILAEARLCYAAAWRAVASENGGDFITDLVVIFCG